MMARAVGRFATNSNLLGTPIGISSGRAPFNIFAGPGRVGRRPRGLMLPSFFHIRSCDQLALHMAGRQARGARYTTARRGGPAHATLARSTLVPVVRGVRVAR